MTDLLRAARDRLTVLRNTLGQPVDTVTDDQGAARGVAPNGRLVVAAGQTISSAWGNTTYDQTMQTFATAGDRTNQWPAPNEGALSYLMDSHTPWIFRSGAWHGLPMGWLANIAGPATTTGYTTTANILTLAVPVVQGRKYRLTSACSGSVGTVAAIVRLTLIDDQGQAVSTWYDNSAVPTPASSARVGNGTLLYVPTSSKTPTLALQYQGGATYSVGANNATLLLEDIGG